MFNNIFFQNFNADYKLPILPYYLIEPPVGTDRDLAMGCLTFNQPYTKIEINI